MASIDWLKIKNDYINTKTSYRKLAEKYGVNKDSIAQRAKQEGWVPSRDIQADKIHTKVIQNTADKIVRKEVDRIARIANLADRIIDKLEEATEQLDHYIVTNKVKVKTVEYDSKVHGKPAKETTTETEKLDIVDGVIDRAGIKQLASALKDLRDIQITGADPNGDGMITELIKGLKDYE